MTGTPVHQRPEILRYFEFSHLSEHLQQISAPFKDLAEIVVANTKACAEQTVALRKLLEAKDAAVRAALDMDRES